MPTAPHTDAGQELFRIPGDGTEHDWSQRYITDPHALFAALRERAPVHRVTLAGTPTWLVVRYADVRRLSTDARLRHDPRHAGGAAARASWTFADQSYVVTGNMLRRDPPEHTRLRESVAREFTGHRAAALGPRIQQIIDDLIDAWPARGDIDLIADFAHQLPMTVIADLLGVDSAHRAPFARLAGAYVGTAEGDTGRVPQTVARMRDELRDMIPTHGTAGILGSLGGALDQDEVLAMAFLLLVAGYETTASLIGNTVLALLRHPDALTELRTSPELVPAAIEECLRWDPPIKISPVPRFSVADIPIGDAVIPGDGQPVVFGYAAANRDPDFVDRPAEFDIHRPRRGGHFGFGHGVHRCLGAGLGQLEVQLAVETLLRRTAEMALAVEPRQLDYVHSRFMRGVRTLPLSVALRGAS
ncbi:MAG: cytochrome P450 [Mycobacteriaceae bacterium]|nr:cytochrome P450 [Mycobacteriaceae bacterium]